MRTGDQVLLASVTAAPGAAQRERASRELKPVHIPRWHGSCGVVLQAGYIGIMPRPVADDRIRIEVRQVPPPGGRVGLRWENVATATLVRDDADVVELHYRWRSEPGEPWRETVQEIRLAYVGCHFGGRQTFFACPSCQRRARKIYHTTGEEGLACRRCGRLVPRSQSLGSWPRALKRATKLRRYCGGSGNPSEPFPPKPKRMRWATYKCLRREAEQLEAVPLEAWLVAGTYNVPLGIRRGTAGAKKRQWWPARNHRAG
jgi:hypothetical protein